LILIHLVSDGSTTNGLLFQNSKKKTKEPTAKERRAEAQLSWREQQLSLLELWDEEDDETLLNRQKKVQSIANAYPVSASQPEFLRFDLASSNAQYTGVDAGSPIVISMSLLHTQARVVEINLHLVN